jgi:hypothetical protein
LNVKRRSKSAVPFDVGSESRRLGAVLPPDILAGEIEQELLDAKCGR